MTRAAWFYEWHGATKGKFSTNASTISQTIIQPMVQHSATYQIIIQPTVQHSATYQIIIQPMVQHSATSQIIIQPTVQHSATSQTSTFWNKTGQVPTAVQHNPDCKLAPLTHKKQQC